MGQQPNVEITLSDMPATTPQPQAPRRWSPTRPGELGSPDEVPWGGAYGTPGPDAGYARTLATKLDLALAEGERRVDAETAVAAIASARASFFGRGPTPSDLQVAAAILVYDSTGIPAAVADRVIGARAAWVADIERQPHKAADLLDAIPLDILIGELGEVRAAVADGAVL